MTEQQAKNIKKNTIVYFKNDKTDKGIIEEVGYTGLLIKWLDTGYSWLDFNNCQNIHPLY